MQEDRRIKAIDRLVSMGLDPDASQDETALNISCSLSQDCREAGDPDLVINFQAGEFRCRSCNAHGNLDDLVREFEDNGFPVASVVREAEYHEVHKAEPNATKRALTPHISTPKHHETPQSYTSPALRPHRNLGERVIITLLALVFLGAGLSAAALSGFANYQAFSSSVTDPLQAGIWGWTGVIAAIISFGGFTFFYWHTANKRMKEGVRALLFALAGAGTSILGTQMYIAANNEAAQAEITTAGSNRALLEQQVSDWRIQLSGIPPETRSVEGLEAYISEVERVGRTEQKPYRDAQNELGLARRRDDLQAKIEAANADLLGKGNGDILIETQARAAIPSWFFAGMLELFSSQGTSIGLVALLILYTRRREAPAD
tara:strand:- start:10386 stop:11510 length:1125 start_codon:yes stop_codon:yes gene_type:complete